MWYETSEREQAAEKLLDLQIITAAAAMAMDPKGCGKFVTALDQNLRAIATGKKSAPMDRQAAVREHVRRLQSLGAKAR
jgi:hypothetical protein